MVSLLPGGTPQSSDVDGYVPIRDDALASHFTPRIVPGNYDVPERILYRMSVENLEDIGSENHPEKNDNGRIFIAYFFVWAYERNDHSGFLPFLSRNLYTGGLSIQKFMFGPGDIEVITIVLEQLPDRQRFASAHGHQSGRNPDAYRIKELHFETAENYDPESFGVKHKQILLKADDFPSMTFIPPPVFQVKSWNHMFDWIAPKDVTIVGDGIIRTLDEQTATSDKKNDIGEKTKDPEIEYFRATEWEHYRMLKEKETKLFRNRAHPHFARESVE